MLANEKFLTFGQPSLGKEEEDEIIDSLRRAWLGTGPKVAQFEKDFLSYKNALASRQSFGTALFSATAGLHLACRELLKGEPGEVITTPLTFCATANAVIHAGGTPVLADIDPSTLNIDPQQIEQQITARTRGIIVVHFAGRPAPMVEILDLAQRKNLFVIEDCAHAIESLYNGQPCGTLGDAGVFSFYATKNLSCGEGGFLLSRNEEFVRNVKRVALHGMNLDAWMRFSSEGYRHYDVVDVGFKYNMTDLQASIGIHQLKKLETHYKIRGLIWARYLEAFKGLPLDLPAPVEEGDRHAFHLFTVALKSEAPLTRDQFLQAMAKAGLGVGVHYRSLADYTVYQKNFGWKAHLWPHAKNFGDRCVSLPLSPRMTSQDLERVVQTVHELLNV